MSCCYLQETWAVIFGWVELSAPRSRSALGKFRATDLHFMDYMLDGSCGGAEALEGSFPLARPAE